MRGPVMHVAVSDRPKLPRLDGAGAARVPTADFRFMPFYKVNDEAYTAYFTQS
jgi:hypothetical protein